MCNEYEIRIPLFFRISADEHFLLRLQIIRASDLPPILLRDKFLDLIKPHSRNILCLRQLDPEYSDLICIFFFEKFHRVLEITGLHSHHILKSLDISHLKIKARIFVQMALCIMFFRPEYRSCLKYSVEHPDHHLFVELRALLKDSRSVKIIQTEQVRPALSTLCPNLRSVDLCKPFAVKEIPESSHETFLNPESRAFP